MSNTPSTTEKKEILRCRYCGKEHTDSGTMEEREIIQRDNRAPRGIRRDRLLFCKGAHCGGNYQMGCEG